MSNKFYKITKKIQISRKVKEKTNVTELLFHKSCVFELLSIHTLLHRLPPHYPSLIFDNHVDSNTMYPGF